MSEGVGRMPPYWEEGERGVLGAVLLGGREVVGRVSEGVGLRPVMFYLPAHQMVAEVAWKLAADPRAFVDVLTVSGELARVGELEKIGGGVFLERLMDGCPTTAHAEYYGDGVRKKWLLREVVAGARDVERGAFEGPEDVEGFVRGAPSRFLDLVGGCGEKEKSNVEVMEENCERWENAAAWKQRHDASKKPAIGLTTPFERLTELLCGLEKDTLTIVGGRPSAGKTTLEDVLALHVAGMGVGVGRVTMDSGRGSLLARAQCRMVGVSLPKLKFGFGRRDQLAAAREAAVELGKLRMWVRTDLWDIAEIGMWALERVRREGMGLLTVDYIQQVRAHELGRAETDLRLRTTYVSGRFKKLAHDLGIPVVVLSQLRRGPEADDAPGMSDLRDSGALEQDADKVLMLSVDSKKKKEMEERSEGASKHKRPVCVDVVKHKDGEQGFIPFWLYPPYFRFEEADGKWEDDVVPGDASELEEEWGVVPQCEPRPESAQ